VRILTAIAAATVMSLSSLASVQAQVYAQPDALDPYARPRSPYTHAPAPQGRAYPYVGAHEPARYHHAYPRARRAAPQIVHRPHSKVVVGNDPQVRTKRKPAVAKVEPEPKAARAPKRADVTGSTGTRRTIRAEAEVTIIGPDRMSIRLFRKREVAPAAPTTTSED